jgi:Fe-S cluster assembly scaffold protein SufB
MDKLAEFILESRLAGDLETFEVQAKKIDEQMKKVEQRWKKYKTTIIKEYKNNPRNAQTLVGSEKQLIDNLERVNNAFPLWATH